MPLTDEELDRNWQPNGRRPQSTIARSFSAELMDIFRIENSVSDLDEQVHQKYCPPLAPCRTVVIDLLTRVPRHRKENVDRNTKELASLEARLREMEERLRSRQYPSGAPSPRGALPDFQRRKPDGPQQQNNINDNLAQQGGSGVINDKQQQHQQQQRAAPGSGNMPPTPGASEDGDGDN